MAAQTYLTIDYEMGQPPDQLAALFNGYGAQGWNLQSIEVKKYNARRAVFMATGTTEYLVIDYDAGNSAEVLTADLNGYGVDGWTLNQVDLARSNVRRAILVRGTGTGGTGGGIEEAPADDKTYGRKNTIWNWAIAQDETLDGGDF
jgi:hypothetical protein